VEYSVLDTMRRSWATFEVVGVHAIVAISVTKRTWNDAKTGTFKYGRTAIRAQSRDV
jgi:uncharacterized membrane protein YccF (DUF307 family)